MDERPAAGMYDCTDYVAMAPNESESFMENWVSERAAHALFVTDCTTTPSNVKVVFANVTTYLHSVYIPTYMV